MIEGPIGPHPVSQFEIVFFRPAYQEFLAWLLVSSSFPKSAFPFAAHLLHVAELRTGHM